MSRTPTSCHLPASARRPLRLTSRFLLAGLLLGRAFALTPPPALPEQPDLGPPPAWVEPTAWTAPDKMEANPNGQDFLVLDEQVRTSTGEHYHHHVYQIVSDAGRQSGAQVYFNFDPSYQRLTIHHLRLVRGAEVSDRLDPAKIQVIQQERDLDRQLYNGERSALVILDDVRLGDIIDLAYTLRGENPVFGGKFVDATLVEWGVPVRDLRYRLLTPADRAITTKLIGGARVTPRMRPRDGEQELLWQRTDLPIVESEERVPDSYPVFSFLDLSEFESWSEVVRWAEPLYAVPAQPDPLVARMLDDIQAKAAGREAQALAALDFVQQEVRYLGIQMGPGSHRPSAPEEVLRRRFGDCKDKSRLLVALLRGLGLDAAPALVHSSTREGIRDRLPTPYAFDHVIVALDFHGQRYLLDPTLSYQRGEGLALRHLGRYGPYLRIAPGPTHALQEMPLSPGDVTDTEIVSVFQVPALDQPATLTVTTKSSGLAAENLRSYFANRTIEQISREYLNYFTTYYPGISQVKPVEHHDNPVTNRYTVTEHYKIERLFSGDTGKALLAEFQPPSMWDYARMPNLAQRRHPLALTHPAHIRERLTIHLPEEWQVTPQKESVTDAAFTLTYEASHPDPRTVQLDYIWESKAHHVTPAQMAAFSANAEKARRNLGYQLTWNGGTANAASEGPGFPPNWPQVGLALGTVLAGSYASWRVARKRNPIPPEPPVIPDATAPVDPYSYRGRASSNEASLGGWLILVGFGLFIRPGWLVHALYDGRAAFFNATVWERLTSTGSELYNPHFSLIAPLEMLTYLFLLIYSLLLLVLFFRRSHLFPRAIQLYFGCTIASAAFMIWDISMLQTDPVGLEAYSNLFQTVVAAAVWIPYFQVSRRVKLTFVR